MSKHCNKTVSEKNFTSRVQTLSTYNNKIPFPFPKDPRLKGKNMHKCVINKSFEFCIINRFIFSPCALPQALYCINSEGSQLLDSMAKETTLANKLCALWSGEAVNKITARGQSTGHGSIAISAATQVADFADNIVRERKHLVSTGLSSRLIVYLLPKLVKMHATQLCRTAHNEHMCMRKRVCYSPMRHALAPRPSCHLRITRKHMCTNASTRTRVYTHATTHAHPGTSGGCPSIRLWWQSPQVSAQAGTWPDVTSRDQGIHGTSWTFTVISTSLNCKQRGK